jgi:hypothetical protein
LSLSRLTEEELVPMKLVPRSNLTSLSVVAAPVENESASG